MLSESNMADKQKQKDQSWFARKPSPRENESSDPTRRNSKGKPEDFFSRFRVDGDTLMVKMKSATEATNAAITAAASAWNKTTETTSSRIKDITRNINTQDAKPPLQDSAVLARQRLQAVKTVFDHLELIGGQTETELIRVLSQGQFVGGPEEDELIEIMWYRQRLGQNVVKIPGLSGGYYQPSADDIGCFISILCIARDNPKMKRELKIGPIMMDPSVDASVKRCVANGEANFEVKKDSHGTKRVRFHVDGWKVSITRIVQNDQLNEEPDDSWNLEEILKVVIDPLQPSTFALRVADREPLVVFDADSSFSRDVIVLTMRSFLSASSTPGVSHLPNDLLDEDEDLDFADLRRQSANAIDSVELDQGTQEVAEDLNEDSSENVPVTTQSLDLFIGTHKESNTEALEMEAVKSEEKHEMMEQNSISSQNGKKSKSLSVLKGTADNDSVVSGSAHGSTDVDVILHSQQELIGVLQEELLKSKKEKDRATAALRGSLNENTSLQQKIKQMNKRLSAIDKEIEACKLIERASEETKQELIQVQGSNTEKDNLIKKLENAIVLIKQEREQERERHVKVEREKAIIQSRMEEISSKLQTVKALQAELADSIGLNQRLSLQCSQFEATISDLQQKLASDTTREFELQEQVTKLKSENGELLTQRNTLRRKLASLTKDIDRIMQTSSESVKQSQQMKEMREHVNKLEEQMSVLRAAKIDAEEQRDGYRDAYNELAEQVIGGEVFERMNGGLTSGSQLRLNEMQQQVCELREDLKEKEELCEAHRKINQELGIRVLSIEKSLKDTLHHIRGRLHSTEVHTSQKESQSHKTEIDSRRDTNDSILNGWKPFEFLRSFSVGTPENDSDMQYSQDPDFPVSLENQDSKEFEEKSDFEEWEDNEYELSAEQLVQQLQQYIQLTPTADLSKEEENQFPIMISQDPRSIHVIEKTDTFAQINPPVDARPSKTSEDKSAASEDSDSDVDPLDALDCHDNWVPVISGCPISKNSTIQSGTYFSLFYGKAFSSSGFQSGVHATSFLDSDFET